MNEMNITEFERKLSSIPEVEPDEWDLELMKEIDAEVDDCFISLDDVKTMRKLSGRISIRVPKSLHAELISMAHAEGTSLNQYILYKLSK